MAQPAAPTPVYLDCDTGIDDALALGYLLDAEQRGTAELVGIGTVHGNIDAPGAAENTLCLLALAGRPGVPVAVGATDPLVGDFAGGAVLVHGLDGVGGVRDSLPVTPELPLPDEDAADLLLRLSHEHEGRLQVLAIGPLTNLALALQRDPSIIRRVAGVTVMGGAALVPGNMGPVVEANIGHDPEAAAEVVAASWPVTLVPLDVTMDHTVGDADRDRLLASPSAFQRALGAMLDVYLGFYDEVVFGRRTAALHDPLAVAVALGELGLRDAPAVDVEVDATDGPGRGQTICDLRSQRRVPGDVEGATTRVVMSADREFAPLLMERLSAL
jgi:purine nucleosidase